MSLERGRKVEVRIERLSVGGRGVARHEGLVLFVDDAAPGDHLEVEITKAKSSFAEARITRILQPSSSRVQPPCPVAGVCGGCNWQHVAYDEQLRQKRALVRESLAKFSGYDVADENAVAPVVASPDEFRYRNRIQLHHAADKLGFFKRGSHAIVDINDCPITETKITSEFEKLHQEFRDQRPGRFEIFISESGRVERRSGNEDLANDEGGLAFAQVNTAQNRQLVARVLELVKTYSSDEKTILDLYAGSGNFSFPMARLHSDKNVIGVELSSDSVRKAQNKIKDLHQTNLSFVRSDVASYLAQNPLAPSTIVVLDPPRTGCDAIVMQSLAQQKNPPAFIIYISCHPVTLARDLKFLNTSTARKYDLISVEPFDMFPQTDHVETVVVLRAQDSR